MKKNQREIIQMLGSSRGKVEFYLKYEKLLEFVLTTSLKNPPSYDDKAFAWICCNSVATQLLIEIGEGEQ
jgi:hypothetical protein